MINQSITSLKAKADIKSKVGVIDIETMVGPNNTLIAYAVGLAYKIGGEVQTKIFYLPKRSFGNIEERSQCMFREVYLFMSENLIGYTLYAHNLGSFDGVLIIRSIYHFFGPYGILLDKSRKIISISLPNDIIIKDSLRLFPLKLEDLGEVFQTEHRKLTFDHTTANIKSISTPSFQKELMKYLVNDLLCLIEVLDAASKMMFELWKIDIHNTFSTSSISFTVFRTKYLKDKVIPVLSRSLDLKIRESYIGGFTDIYTVLGKDLFYYDVNSLYPHAMCNDMPYEYKGFKYRPNLESFFGFIKAHIYVPKNTQVPLVGVKDLDGSLIHPTGHIVGIYFSEELKAFKRYGYTVNCLFGYEFTKKDIFTNFINDLYPLKVNSSGPKRELVKLILNGLYGYFGRTMETISAKFINSSQIDALIKTNHTYDIIPMDEINSLVLSDTLPDKGLCNETGISYGKELGKTLYKNPVLANVAIASAITSYARIHMIQFKTIPNNPPLYTDNDSVFLAKPLPPEMIHPSKLGYIKDELKGGIIKEAIFLEPKLYYYVKDDGIEVIRSRGVPKGVMKLDDFKALHSGKTLFYNFKRLYKSVTSISIQETNTNYSIRLQMSNKIPLYSKGQLVGYKAQHFSFLKFTAKYIRV